MSSLFTPLRIGRLELANRLVRSSTFENMAAEDGQVTDRLLNYYERLARHEVGLIITGDCYVHPLGRSAARRIGIHRDEMVPGLARLAATVHGRGGKLVLQLAHAGRQTQARTIGQTPLAPSRAGKDPVLGVRPRAMDEREIRAVVAAFGDATRRAARAGADGVQIHAAHGYLLSEFLSPMLNRRKDAWGGSPEGRFRLVGEVVRAVRAAAAGRLSVSVKLNSDDGAGAKGVSVPLAVRYAKWLAELGVDAVEMSSGLACFTPFHIVRGQIPMAEILRLKSWLTRLVAGPVLRRMAPAVAAAEGYNAPAAKLVKAVAPGLVVGAVGGWRHVDAMERALAEGQADFVSLCRPFIREPDFASRVRAGTTRESRCESCNRCFVAVGLYDLPLACYREGIPQTS